MKPSWQNQRDAITDQHLPAAWSLDTPLFKAPVDKEAMHVIAKEPAIALDAHKKKVSVSRTLEVLIVDCHDRNIWSVQSRHGFSNSQRSATTQTWGEEGDKHGNCFTQQQNKWRLNKQKLPPASSTKQVATNVTKKTRNQMFLTRNLVCKTKDK